jgi:amino acid adenylation domain-containing protein/non-ribosomal peptide synthase protein (TIGR01720 family)
MKYKTFSCYIIGQSGLTLQCAELVINAGHVVLGIITNHAGIQDWAKDRNIPCSQSLSFLDGKSSFDYLFSIVNDEVLPKTILNQPRYLAINFHDALLPRYAGMHATSWAILNGEQAHGITWHVMTDGVDAGDILKSAIIAIESEETAFSLNLKCYEQAKNSFVQLLEELATQSFTRTPQNLNQRTYYGRYDKFPNYGLIDWHNSADIIGRLVRALEFGNQPNPLGTAKLVFDKKIYILKELTVTTIPSQQTPGNIVKLTKDYMQIATTTTDVLITRLNCYNGSPCPIAMLHQHFGRQSNDNLLLALSLDISVEKQSKIYAKYESFWVEQFIHLSPPHLPFFPTMPKQNADLQIERQLVTVSSIPNTLKQALMSRYQEASFEDLFLSVFFIYFYRVTRQTISLFFTSPDLKKQQNPLADFFSISIPMTLELQDNFDFEKVLNKVIHQRMQLQKKETYAIDILDRYPQCSHVLSMQTIEIEFVESSQAPTNSIDSLITILISKKEAKITIYLNGSVVKQHSQTFLNALPDHILTLLTGIIAHPHQMIAYLPLLTAGEQQNILSDWNQTASSFSNDKTIHLLFEEQATKTPDYIALVFNDQAFTYRELNRQANQIASCFKKMGITHGARIVLCLERQLAMVAAQLGILKVGGIYVPIEPHYPLSRIKYIIEDSKPLAIVTQSSVFNEVLTKYDAINQYSLLLLDQLKHSSSDQFVNPNFQVISDDLAYIIYTSGSTGQPKGVLVSHKSVVNCILAIQQCADIKSEDIFLALTSCAFDVAMLDYYLPLSVGAKVIIADRRAQKDANCLINLIEKNSVTAIQATPSTCELIRLLGWQAPHPIKMLVAGEALSPALADYLRENCLLFNIYGPTETTIYATFALIKENTPITIGKPLFNVQCFVLDKNLQPLPIGYTGELHIGGVSLAHGYFNQPQLTEEKFIKSPFSTDPHARLYKTGDLVRWLPNGELEYLGRLDNQVKIRGFRIELGEVEQALLHHPQIAQSVVLAHRIPAGHQQLIAFIVPMQNAETALNTNILQSFLQEILPDYMIPAAYVILTALPLNTNGKIDHKALLKQTDQALPANLAYQSPETSLEKQLVSLWQSVLGISLISVEDNFFALGGDSILAIQIIAKANEYGLSFSVSDIFERPTIAELSKVAHSLKLPQPLEEFTDAIPLTPIQHWFFEEAWTAPAQWSQACLVRTSSLNMDCLQRAIRYLTTQHDALRLCYQQNSQVWQQHYIKGEVPILFEQVVLNTMPEENQLIAEWGRIIQARFDLNKGPLIGVVIFLDSHHAVQQLLFVIHHLLIDGVSWRILLAQLSATYQNLSAQQKPPKLLQSTSFAHWATALESVAQAPQWTMQHDYWLDITSKCKSLPEDNPQGENIEGSSEVIQLQLDHETTENLLGPIHSVYQTHINDVLLTALLKVFTDWMQHNTLVLDLESHGRQNEIVRLNSVNTIGWFTSLFPVSLTLINSDWGNLLLSVKQQLQNIPQQGFGYSLLRYLSPDQKLRESLLKQPQPQISFNYWGQFQRSANEASFFQWNGVSLVAGKKNHRKHLLNIDCVVRDGCFVMNWTYSRNRHLFATIEHLAKNYQKALIELIQHCKQQIKISKTLACFTSVKLTNEQIQHLNDTHPGIENIYPLTPLQQGLLFQQWRDPAANSYELQIRWTVNQRLDICALQQACQKLVQRHSIFRTLFVWQELEEPIQVVLQCIQLPWKFYDWRHLATEQQVVQLRELINADQQKSTDLRRAPLFRINLIQLSDNQFEIIWHMHHLLVDGWSFAILLAELADYYQAAATKKISDDRPLHSFVEYVQWLHQQDWTTAKIFWQNYLQGFTEPTDLAITASVPLSENSVSSPSYTFMQIELSEQHSKSIRSFAQSCHITLSTLFQGLWGLLLSRYSQSKDVIFGVTVSGRSIPLSKIEQRVGLFINTLPMRINFADETVIQYLTRLQKDFISLSPYSHTPLSFIQNWSELHNSDQALFDSIVVFENYPLTVDSNFCKQLQFWDPTHYALTFIITSEPSIKMKIGYDARRMTSDSTSRLLGHLQQLLISMTTHRENNIDILPLLSLNEYQQLITQNKNRIPFPRKTVTQLFEEQAIKVPHQLAVAFNEQVITYQQLNHRSNQLAHYLIARGVSLETPVALCLPRNLDMIVGLLGIWKAGGVYVPFDPQHPCARLKRMLSISQIHFILTYRDIFEKTFANEFSAFDGTFLLLDEQQAEITKYPITNPTVPKDRSHLAYILYTSGTTGQPKGVAQEHKTLMNLVHWQTRVCSQKIHRRISQFASISFDVSLQEITYALSNGYELHIIPSDIKQSLSILLKFIERQQINQVFLPTALLEPFCDAGLFADFQLSALTDILVAGEALKISSAIKDFFSHYLHIRLTNQYGPTETHVVSAYRLPIDSRTWPSSSPIGTPIDNIELYVLDAKYQPVPIGIPGSLYVSGVGLARDYIGDLTTPERFITLSFNTESTRCYQTGDKVRLRTDGLLEYLGRMDQQLKIRGHRVEPGEIEAEILKQPGIRQCVVTAVHDPTNTLQLVCYLVSKFERQQNTSVLQKALAVILPHYMIPNQFVWLKALPLTTNGKVDKQVLPKPNWELIHRDTANTTTNKYDNHLLQIWTEILGLKHCHIDDNFMELGGHSLMALKMILKIEKEFHVQLTVNDLYLAPTVGKLSAKIQQLKAKQSLTQASTIRYGNAQLPFPIVPLQLTGDKMPLFLIHPVGGTLFWFMDLVRYLGTKRPFYGIQDPAIMNHDLVFNTLEEMAAFYLHCLRQVQPQGPYLIAGASFGATVAFDIAKQLKENNEEAAFVGLLDGWAFYPKALQNKTKFEQIMRHQCQELYMRFQVNQLENYDDWLNIHWHRNELLWQYPLTPVDTKLTLFKAQKLIPKLAWADHPYNYWNDYSTQPLRVCSIPGDHETMFKEPNIQSLANSINVCLQELD